MLEIPKGGNTDVRLVPRQSRVSIEGRRHSSRWDLTDQELACALAILAWLRNEDEPPWANCLRLDIRRPMLSAMRWLAEIDEATGLPRGSRLDQSLRNTDPVTLLPHPVIECSSACATDDAEGDANGVDHVTQGIFDLMAGRVGDAVRELSEAIQENPDDVEAYQQRALAYIALNRPEEALRDGQSAVRLAPDEVESHFARGKALMINGLLDQAIKDLSTVIDESDDSVEGTKRLAEAHHQCGLAWAAQGDLRAAIKNLTRAIHNAPYRAELYDARADVYEHLDERHSAERDRKAAEDRRAVPPS